MNTTDTMDKMYYFKICTDAGIISFICASCKKEAIEIFCEDNGINKDYIKQHCIIKNMGGVKAEI